MALGAYLTVRMQLQATLDDSLLHRAETAASRQPVPRRRRSDARPSYFGAADVWVACIDAAGHGA